MEREGGVVGRLLGHGVLDKRIPPLWESRPEEFHLAGEVLALATGLIVHSRYVEERARAAGFEGPVWRVPHPAWEVPPVAPAGVEGSPLVGSFPGNVILDGTSAEDERGTPKWSACGYRLAVRSTSATASRKLAATSASGTSVPASRVCSTQRATAVFSPEKEKS